MSNVRRSMAWLAAQSYIGVVLQLLATMAISRVLAPEDIGVFGVAAALSAVASHFRDFGIAEYLIQAKNLENRHIRAAFAVNIAVSWAMALALFAASEIIGRFYRSDEVAQVLQVQSIAFLLIPFGAISMAWYRRQMNFKPLFIASLGSDLLSPVVAVTLALRGHGALSLAWAALAGVTVSVAVSIYFRPPGFPRWPSVHGMREVWRFGGFAGLIPMVNQLGRGAPDLVTGRVLGVVEVAILSRGGGLVQMFRQLVGRVFMPVCLPFFAAAVRNSGSLVAPYARGVTILTGVSWPVLGFLMLNAFPSIRLVYGDQWAAAVVPAQILCAAACVEVVHQLSKDALLAHGLAKQASVLQIVLQLVQLVGLAAVVPFGLEGLCWGLLASSVVGLLLCQLSMSKHAGLHLANLMGGLRQSALVTVLSLIPATVVHLAMPPSESNYLRTLLLASPLTAVAWIGALIALKHPIWDELQRLLSPLLRARLARLLQRHDNVG